MNLHELYEQLQLSEKGVTQLQQQLKEFVFQQQGPVIHKGQTVSGAYIVMQGKLRVFTYSAEGSEATLYFLHPGEVCVLTLNCLFNNFRYPAWVEAYNNTKIAFIPGDSYRQLFTRESSIQDMTVKALSTLVFQLMDALEEVKTCNIEQRLARFILNNASTEGKLKITQQELAHHIGTTREGVARLMVNFKAANMVTTGRGNINIKNEALLAAIVTPAKALWPS